MSVPVRVEEGLRFHQAGDLASAERVYRSVLAADPANADANHLLGALAHQVGRSDIAVVHIGRAIAANPKNPAYFNNLGAAQEALKAYPEAVSAYSEAIRLAPHFAEAHCNLGNALRSLGKLDEAVTRYRQAIQLAPYFPDALLNLGVTLYELERTDEAIACLQRASVLRPRHAETLSNLGHALKGAGGMRPAIDCLEQAIREDLHHVSAHWNLALALLLTGEWERGWAEYEWRCRRPGVAPRHFSRPLWDGAPLEGRTILLHSEQGLGDTIQFVRFAKVVQSLGAKTVVVCQKALVPLLANTPGIDRLIGEDEPLPEFDCHAPLLSLPYILGITPATIPCPIPYLTPDPTREKFWNARLSALDPKGCFNVGICWQGNPDYPLDRQRSVSLTHFERLAAIQRVRLVSLQRGITSERLQAIGLPFAVFSPGDLDREGGAFMDTAAILRSLDLVITVDSAVAHVAGALGTPTWLVLTQVPDWRWLLDSEETPWYPSLRLFRQRAPGDWAGVFRRMAWELELRLANQDRFVAGRIGVEAMNHGDPASGVRYLEIANPTGALQAQGIDLLGVAKAELGQLDESIAVFERAIEANPRLIDAWNNLGNVLWRLDRLDEAEAKFRTTVRLNPRYAVGLCNLGAVLVQLGRVDEGIQYLYESVRVQGNWTNALVNLGLALLHRGRYSESLRWSEMALRESPGHPQATLNLGLASLTLGDFDRGWPAYEARWAATGRRRDAFWQSLWDGSPRPNGALLLQTEQGVGDTLQFLRYAPLARERVARVIVECERPLLPLLSRCQGVDTVIAKGDPRPPFDVFLPILTLPGIFGTTFENMPRKVPYVFADPALIAKWRERFVDGETFNIGLCWKGSGTYQFDRLRSIPLKFFAPLSRVPNTRFYSLQAGPAAAEARLVGKQFRVHEFGVDFDRKAGAFMDSAAVITHLDLVISADTSIGHLAGAMGVPAWIALSVGGDWRWFADREDSPWYPATRLFRQKQPGDWGEVFERMAGVLAVETSNLRAMRRQRHAGQGG